MAHITESDLLGVRRVIDVPPDDAVTMLAYGAGVNSTALLCGWVERGLKPIDLVIFSDTGGERSKTYAYIERLNHWLVARNYPVITVVRALRTLEADCWAYGRLPSLAYGFKGCSGKFKTEPQVKWMNAWATARTAWARGERILKLTGYDADEAHRADHGERQDRQYWYRYPLIEWGWGRSECVAAIERAGLPVPPKSACFFCPANTVAEIKELQRDYPDLLARALAMEAQGLVNATSVAGLGRRFSWRALVEGRPLPLFTDTQMPCDCYDGADE